MATYHIAAAAATRSLNRHPCLLLRKRTRRCQQSSIILPPTTCLPGCSSDSLYTVGEPEDSGRWRRVSVCAMWAARCSIRHNLSSIQHSLEPFYHFEPAPASLPSPQTHHSVPPTLSINVNLWP